MTDLFTDPHAFGDLDRWRRRALELHAKGPIHRVEAEGFHPFWAITDLSTLREVEGQPALFTNRPEPVLARIADREAQMAQGGNVKALIHMDDPEHRKYRSLTSDWFKPASIRRMAADLDALSVEAIATLEGLGGSCDFASEVALPFPLRVILRLLGLPEEDFPRMLMLTQQLFGADDPDLQREPLGPEKLAAVLADFYSYFTELTKSRRAHPTDDLATLIANGEIDDAPMPELEQMGYYLIVATAGHDTTSSAMAGGVQAFAEHPEQLAALQERPELLDNAVEEILRWTSPVRHFMRTATADTEIAGQPIREGDWIYLSYLAANHDPDVFDDPLRFDIARPNADQHIAFGYGVHFCLGSHLARMELRSLFRHLVPRLASLELAGPAPAAKTLFVGGPKRVPIRYALRPH